MFVPDLEGRRVWAEGDNGGQKEQLGYRKKEVVLWAAA